MRAADRPIDVVIPLFNGGPWIEETLAGVFSQTAPVGRVIVVDDGGTDDGAKRARRFEDRVEIVPSLGRRRARLTGLLAAQSPLVAFLDQDDVWHASHLAGLATTLARSPDAPAAASGIQHFRDGAPPRFKPRGRKARPLDPWATWPWVCPLETPSAVLWRRAALRAADAWAPAPAPDWQAYLRVARRQPLLRRAASTCAYRLHPAAHSAALRRDGLAYLDVVAGGVATSHAERIRDEPDGALRTRLQRRRQAFEAFARLLRADRVWDGAGAEAAARHLERHLQGEPDRHLALLPKLAAYLLCPDDAPGEFRRRRRALLDGIVARLPEDAPTVRRTFGTLADQESFRWRRLVRHVVKGRLRSAAALWRRRG